MIAQVSHSSAEVNAAKQQGWTVSFTRAAPSICAFPQSAKSSGQACLCLAALEAMSPPAPHFTVIRVFVPVCVAVCARVVRKQRA